jgi:glycogen phosphorylase
MAFEKIPSLPRELHGLEILASNFYYSWNRGTREVFSAADEVSWRRFDHNPKALIRNLSLQRIEELKQDVGFAALLRKEVEAQQNYLNDRSSSWFARTYSKIHASEIWVAYFSMEFGITSFLRIYSGGLGILSGDHLKSSSDLGIPLVGVGLFYGRGYFSQEVSEEGWQMESYPSNDPENLPLNIVLDKDSKESLIFSVPLADREVYVQAWKAEVGTISLYLLDTNIPGWNSKEDCEITGELYGGDSDLRIKQEIVLGFGGARLLRILGLNPSIFHMNEGHSSFVSLERIAQAVERSGNSLSFREALEEVKATTIFTTHTPVPAGIDIFTRGQVDHYLSQCSKRLGIAAEDLFSLGQETPESNGFNMAVFAIRTSSIVNGVSRLHRHVASKLWKKILQEEEYDIGENRPDEGKGKLMRSVTNGVHIPSWISGSMATLFDEYLGENWALKAWRMDTWRGVSQIPPERLWAARQNSRSRLLDFISRRLGGSRHSFDPDVLTVGFARRFATYKRATLLFSDRERLGSLLTDPEKPVQFVFAGKAHPKDNEGKKFIQEIVSFLRRESGGKIVFLPDYDIDVARNMVQGVDVWLNNPRRPLEASGTSGMKVLCNGGLNLSVLDGWWDEAYTPSNGWAIGTGIVEPNHALQDRQDAESLYDLLQNHVTQEFYERTNGLPLRWIERMRRSISGLVPRFSSDRMVIEYAENFYFRNLPRA